MQISGLLEEHIHIHQKTGATVQTTHPSKDKVKSTDKHIHQKTGSKVQTTHPPKDRVNSTDNTSTKKTGSNVQTTQYFVHEQKICQ